MTSFRQLCLVGLSCVAMLFIAACGSAPKVQSVKTANAPTMKVSQIYLIYHEANLKTTSSWGKGEIYGVQASAFDTGLGGFGQQMAARAKPAFEPLNIAVPDASVVAVGGSQGHIVKLFTGKREQLHASHLLVITPLGGLARANLHSARVELQFNVRLVEGATSKTVWESVIDTSTWQGKDFITKPQNDAAMKFDAAYADLFYSKIIESLKSSKLI
jgi:hypothetical protein